MFAALVAAGATSVSAAYLTQRPHGPRGQLAAQIPAVKLDDEPPGLHSLAYYVADELRETRHAGIAFAIFDRNTHQLLEGDARVPVTFDTSCTHSPTLRACGVPARANLWVVAAASRLDLSWL